MELCSGRDRRSGQKDEGGEAGREARRAAPGLAAGAAVVLWLSFEPAAAATLSLPADAGAPSRASTVVSLTIDDATGALGTDILIAYDPSVALATSVSTTSLTAGQTLTANLSPPGSIRISLYGAYPLSGGGALVDISFTSVGTSGAQTVLDLVSARLNEGAIPATLIDGRYCVQGQVEEVRLLGVHLSSPASTVAVLSWLADPYATSFNVYRGNSPDLTDLGCYRPGVTTLSVSDSGEVPVEGGLFVFIVTAVNCRGESSLGSASSGESRINPHPCP